jgi:L-threonylcarbamoyladenylate synthase
MSFEILNHSIDILKSGGTLIYPTDTIWGLGCDARNAEAVDKVYELKNRPDSKSLIVLVCDDAMLNKYVTNVPEVAWDLLDVADRPLTIIYPAARGLAKNCIAEDGTIAIRMVKEGFAYDLIRRSGIPLVSTSANLSGEPSALSKEELNPALAEAADYVVDLPDQGSGKASSIVKVGAGGQIEIIRK